eukprot:m.204703 g.204703  ORF g.204703 m.204703 type:complete len:558 (-) comp32897_c2_seq1:418-2091(-)
MDFEESVLGRIKCFSSLKNIQQSQERGNGRDKLQKPAPSPPPPRTRAPHTPPPRTPTSPSPSPPPQPPIEALPSQSKTSWVNLPEEVWEHVIKFCGLWEQGNLAQVCKKLSRLRWRMIELPYGSSVGPPRLEESVQTILAALAKRPTSLILGRHTGGFNICHINFIACRLTHIDFGWSVDSLETASLIRAWFATNGCRVTTVVMGSTLSSRTASDACVDILLEVIEGLALLKDFLELQLISFVLRGRGGEVVEKLLSRMRNPIILSLVECELTKDSVPALTRAFNTYKTSLAGFKISEHPSGKHRIGAHGIGSLMHAAKQLTYLHYLALDHCRLGKTPAEFEWFEPLCALVANGQLTHLMLTVLPLCDKATSRLTAALQSASCRLMVLKLSACAGASKLNRLLWRLYKMPTLRELHVLGGSLNSSSLEIIAKQIGRGVPLTLLDISYKIGGYGYSMKAVKLVCEALGSARSRQQNGDSLYSLSKRKTSNKNKQDADHVHVSSNINTSSVKVRDGRSYFEGGENSHLQVVFEEPITVTHKRCSKKRYSTKQFCEILAR